MLDYTWNVSIIVSIMGKKQRHHFIPRFYLEGFVDPHNKPYVWTYEKGNIDIIKASPADIAVQKHYYSFTTEEGSKDSESFEDLFATIESNVAPLVSKLEQQKGLGEDEKKLFSYFLAFMMTRVPNFRNDIEESNSDVVKRIAMWMAGDSKCFEAMIENYEKDTGEDIGIPINELREFVLDDSRYSIKTNPEFSLFIILELSKSFARVFYKMNWLFLMATDENKFLTSDNPLYYFDPTYDPKSPFGVGLINKNIQVTIPISNRLAILAGWNFKKDNYFKANGLLVRGINKRTIISALRYVYASEKSDTLNKLVQKYENSAPRTVID